MGFNPSQQTRDNADLAVRYGLGGVVPASGGARRVFYENARKGGNLRVRIEAAQAQGYSANTIAEIEYLKKLLPLNILTETNKELADRKRS